MKNGHELPEEPALKKSWRSPQHKELTPERLKLGLELKV